MERSDHAAPCPCSQIIDRFIEGGAVKWPDSLANRSVVPFHVPGSTQSTGTRPVCPRGIIVCSETMRAHRPPVRTSPERNSTSVSVPFFTWTWKRPSESVISSLSVPSAVWTVTKGASGGAAAARSG